MTPSLPLARHLARRMIAPDDGSLSANPASAAAMAGEQFYRSLSQWIGADGCHALFARARAESRTAHPALDSLQLSARGDRVIDGLDASIAKYDQVATANAIEAMLVAVINLLGRIIGLDMAANLIERSLAAPASDSAKRDQRREKA
jgi:hypothetical protein